MKQLLIISTVAFFISNCSTVDVAQEKNDLLTDDALEIPVSLVCYGGEMDEYGVPQSQVFFEKGDSVYYVANCLACETISPSEYPQFEIPNKALSLVGGWWAGGGDYFYLLKNKDT